MGGRTERDATQFPHNAQPCLQHKQSDMEVMPIMKSMLEGKKSYVCLYYQYEYLKKKKKTMDLPGLLFLPSLGTEWCDF